MISPKMVAIETSVTNTPNTKRNTLPMISPATPMMKATTRRTAPNMVVVMITADFRNICPMLIVAVISFWFWFFIYADLRALGVCFTVFSVFRLSDIFFMRLPVTSVCFCFRGFIKVGFREYKVFLKNTTRQRRRGDFFENRRLDLVFTWRTRIYLCSWTETTWGVRLRRIIGGKRDLKTENEKENGLAFARKRRLCT